VKRASGCFFCVIGYGNFRVNLPFKGEAEGGGGKESSKSLQANFDAGLNGRSRIGNSLVATL
jgi:hypothetical protein